MHTGLTCFLKSWHSSGVSVSAFAMSGMTLTLSWSLFINSMSRGFRLKDKQKKNVTKIRSAEASFSFFYQAKRDQSGGAVFVSIVLSPKEHKLISQSDKWKPQISLQLMKWVKSLFIIL